MGLIKAAMEVRKVQKGFASYTSTWPKLGEDRRMAFSEPIKGYRQLSALELELTNMVKEHAEETLFLIEKLEDKGRNDIEIDKRWIAIAQTNLQQGYMALVRAITKPETF